MMSIRKKDTKWVKISEEAYKASLYRPPFQSLHPESPTQNDYNNTSYSHIGDEGNKNRGLYGWFLTRCHYHGGNVVTWILEIWYRGWYYYHWYLLGDPKILFHHPSLLTWIKVYQTTDTNVTVQLEINVWHVRGMFLRNF